MSIATSSSLPPPPWDGMLVQEPPSPDFVILLLFTGIHLYSCTKRGLVREQSVWQKSALEWCYQGWEPKFFDSKSKEVTAKASCLQIF